MGHVYNLQNALFLLCQNFKMKTSTYTYFCFQYSCYCVSLTQK